MEQTLSTAFPWTPLKKIMFRFGFLYFVLYIIYNPNGIIPYAEEAYAIYILPISVPIDWLGKHLLHLNLKILNFDNGSGDTTYNYVTLLFLAIISILGSIIWTIADRKRKHYIVLNYWLVEIIRYYLIFNMFSYGSFKVIKLQFPFPSLNGLLEPYGNSSPMHLAWTFFGYSTGYNYFTGLAEIACGVLLLFRRTTRMGALLSLVVMSNIMAVNYSFDVCVKLLSTMLVIMSLYILLQDRKALANFYLFNRPADSESGYVPVYRKKWLKLSLLLFKYAFVIFVFYKDFSFSLTSGKQYGDNAPKPPLYGIYNVHTFVRNNDTLPPLLTDTTRWRRIVFPSSGRYSTVTLMNDSLSGYRIKVDTLAKKVEMIYVRDTLKRSNLAYSTFETDSLVLRGKWQGDSVIITFKRFDENRFLLVNRGFHFINETPYNR